jgi:hypothetical protein
VYGWYTTKSKRHEPKHDLYWQVVYYLCPADQHKAASAGRGPGVPIFENCVKAGSVTGFIVGGAPRGILEADGVIRSDQDGARYRAIYPICFAYDAEKMAETTLYTLSEQFCKQLPTA